MCYLPPEGSSRYENVDEFVDTLLTKIYQYQGMGEYYICGDFNSRLGDLVGYIEGVDEVPQEIYWTSVKMLMVNIFVIF